MPENVALWLPRRGAALEVGPAPYTAPGPGEIVVRVRAVAVNPVDTLPGFLYRVVLPWLTFPAVIGGDVSGDVVDIGPGVTNLRVGDRVLGLAAGAEQNRNRAAEGAFQRYAVLLSHMASVIPDDLAYEQACVLPLTLSTAATGLFQDDHLGLPLPSPEQDAPDRGETVLVWGGSTSVGSNAIQLARASGYRVVTTASPRNFAYVRSLGAHAAVDYRDRDAVGKVVTAIGGSPLAGSLAIGGGSIARTLAVAARVPARVAGGKRIASAQPGIALRLSLLGRRRHDIRVSGIWGGTLKDNEVGPGIFVDYLPSALAAGRFRAAPDADVVGEGLDRIPEALRRLRRGVSAKKLVVRVD